MQDNAPRIMIMEDPCRGNLGTVRPGIANEYLVYFKACMLNDIPWKEKIRLIRTIEEEGIDISTDRKQNFGKANYSGRSGNVQLELVWRVRQSGGAQGRRRGKVQ